LSKNKIGFILQLPIVLAMVCPAPWYQWWVIMPCNAPFFEFNCVEPGAILDKARVLIAETFSNQKTETVKDGMDISLVAINKIQNTVLWAGAHNPLWTMDIHGLHEIKATKQSVGFAFDPKPFTTHAIPYQENLYIFLFTDGMPDQFGGAKGKKMKYKQFSELLMQNYPN